jgi:hypothetical protein
VRDRLRRFSARLEAPGVRPRVMSGLVLALLLASAAAFAVAERLKLERSPVAAPELSRVIGPECECEKAEGTLSVRLRRPAVVTASVVNADGDTIRVLAEREQHRRGRVTWVWDGRDDDGEVVPDGLYRLRLDLVNRDRTITVPTPIRIDTKPPRVRLLEAGPTTITPDPDAAGAHQIQFHYVSTELGYSQVEVEDDVVFRGRLYPAGEGRVRWRGRKDGGPAPPGVYRTVLVVVDRAGNRSNPTRPVRVRILPVGG